MANKAEVLEDAERASLTQWLTLALLGLAYVLSFVDRFILALIIVPLKEDLQIDNVQVGILFGTAFAVFYAFSSIPLARIADRYNRKWLIIGGIVVWSACTVLSGFAENFATLATLRFGLAVGEAALVPAGISLLTDMFPARNRVFAITLFSSSGMAGAATAFIIGGLVVAQAEGLAGTGMFADMSMWQTCFVLVGVPGLFLAALMGLLTYEPARIGEGAEDKVGFAEIWAHVRSNSVLYPGMFIGGGFALIGPTAMTAWAPTYLGEVFGLSPAQAGYRFGIANFVAAVGGTLLIPLVIQKLGLMGKFRVLQVFPALLLFVAPTILILSLLSGNELLLLVGHGVAGLMMIGIGNSIFLNLQPFMPPRMRAVLTAVALMFISSFALGVAPPMVGLFASLATDAEHPMQWGLAATSLVGMLGAVPLFLLASGRFRQAIEQVSANTKLGTSDDES